MIISVKYSNNFLNSSCKIDMKQVNSKQFKNVQECPRTLTGVSAGMDTKDCPTALDN